jgi:hypothetical protein
MPKSVTGSGTNSAGNNYTSYSDGSYRYSNTGSGSSGGKYYGDSYGNGFYNNASKGTSSYTRSDGSGWTNDGSGRRAK